MEGTKTNPINWPSRSNRLNDYSQPFLQSMAFPTLLSYGKGDLFNLERNIDVILTKSNKQLLKYAMFNKNSESDELESSYIYPFAEHNRWLNWSRNINECHLIFHQCNNCF